jgi:hypothetical protein
MCTKYSPARLFTSKRPAGRNCFLSPPPDVPTDRLVQRAAKQHCDKQGCE